MAHQISFTKGVLSAGSIRFMLSDPCFLSKDTADQEFNIILILLFPTSPVITIALLATEATYGDQM